MVTLITLFIILLYLLSIFFCMLMMISKNIEPGCLSLLCVMVPVVNTVLAVIFLIKKDYSGSSKVKEFWRQEKEVFNNIFTFKNPDNKNS